ncbi:unnamed protein product [Rhizopus stolonifer]
MIALKKETALTRVSKFRQDWQEMRTQFEFPENPYQPTARDEFALREQSFTRNTDTQLDDFIEQAQNLLENLTDQHNILKKTQKKILDAANHLGLSQNVIRYIERRSAQDKWIFYGGMVLTVLIIWGIIHFL